MDAPRCASCDGTEWSSNHFLLPTTRACRGCGLVRLDPLPEADAYRETYPPDYFDRFGIATCGEPGGGDGRAGWFASLLVRLERLAPPDPSRRTPRLLDVGCGTGGLLRAARARGWEAVGLEPHPESAARLDAEFPGALVPVPIEKSASAAAFLGDRDRFDAATLTDVLEHLVDPAQALRLIHRLVRPGGLLLITTVDRKNWLARLSGRRWIHYHREHLWYFCRPTLRRLVERQGFEPVVHGSCWRKYPWRYVAALLRFHARSRLGRLTAGAASAAVRWLPRAACLPPLPEGQLLIARRRSGSPP